jgi:hypothetical protein
MGLDDDIISLYSNETADNVFIKEESEDAKISGGEAVGDRENSGQRNSKEFDIIVEIFQITKVYYKKLTIVKVFQFSLENI